MPSEQPNLDADGILRRVDAEERTRPDRLHALRLLRVFAGGDDGRRHPARHFLGVRRPRERDEGACPQDFRAEVGHAAVRLFAESLRDRDDEHLGRDEPLERADDRGKVFRRRREDDDFRALHRLFAVGGQLQRVGQRHALEELLVSAGAAALLDVVGERAPDGHVVSIARQQERVRRAPATIANHCNFHADSISHLNWMRQLDFRNEPRGCG